MNVSGKKGFILPERYGKPEDMIQHLLITKVTEEHFDHWGYLSFSKAMSRIISLSLVHKIGEN
ncbi:MAG: hypothetical protein K2I90_13025 [Odoribacter sp.]|nr:hypothetical protein [Odoribacter sp.]MDE7374688.1 hypothetical protein [Odoribacter sp.]